MKKAFLVAAVAALLLPVFSLDPASLLIKSRQRGVDVQVMNNLKQIFTMMQMAADEGNGSFPGQPGAAGLAEIAVSGSIPPALFIVSGDREHTAAADPAKITEKNTSFFYLGNLVGRPDAPGAGVFPLLIEKPRPGGDNKVLVLFADGNCEEIELARPGMLSAVTTLRDRAKAAPDDARWKQFTEAAEKFEAETAEENK